MMLFFGSLLFLFRYFLSFWRSLVLSLFGTAIISGLLLFFPVDFPFFITAAGPILVLSHFIHYVMEGKTQLFHHLWQILLHFILGFVALVFHLTVSPDYQQLYLWVFWYAELASISWCLHLHIHLSHKRKNEEEPHHLKKYPHRRRIEYALSSKSHRDNLASYPLTVAEIERAEENAHNHLHDADMRMFEKEINLKRERVHNDHRFHQHDA